MAEERPPADSTPPPPPPAPPRLITFQYTGATGLTVRGPVTGQVYRFAQPGAHLAVDARDAAFFGGVPRLRRAVGGK